MTPVPFRGKRNDPSFILLTLDKLSEIRKEDKETIADALYRNALMVYGLPAES